MIDTIGVPFAHRRPVQITAPAGYDDKPSWGGGGTSTRAIVDRTPPMVALTGVDGHS